MKNSLVFAMGLRGMTPGERSPVTSVAFVMRDIFPAPGHEMGIWGRKSGFTRRGGGFAVGVRSRARCAAMMPKRLVAAVLVAALVLAGGGILGSLFF
ncbi:hypothetical protein GCM10027598_01130 [Amycolatopsis oliviviridis]|uniref:Uncharacterized protein n=1 Tax=Amycolatopsis oliviviridis TaxID=1471590 RepID=A0ABQ3LRI1_9PSEU|nr:hypothetical protein GCM10017790_44740 [Amycolatopsis oliviviridis]